MNTIVITSNAERFTRVSKTYARKHYQQETIAVCPSKLRPGFPWAPQMILDKTEDFDKSVDEFAFYNCTHETGYYPAFYRVRELAQ